MSKRDRDVDLSSESGSDLEDFIVKDKRYKELKGLPVDEEESESEEEVISEPLPEDGPELAKVLQDEAQKIIGGSLKSTEVNGRSLRSRDTIQKPKDTYWERYGQKDYEKLMVKDRKKDLLDEIKMFKKELAKGSYDVTLPDDFQWPSLTIKDTLERIEAAHQQVCDALGIESEDEDDDDAEQSIHSSDDEESEESDEEEEDSEDEEDSDEDSEDEDDSEE